MTDRHMELVKDSPLEDRVAELERAMAAILRSSALDAPAGTIVVVSTEDLLLVVAAAFATIALMLSIKLARL